MSRILGVKLTHDAAIALIVDGELVFSNELEKIGNLPRHAHVETFGDLATLVDSEELLIEKDVDTIALDGWKYGRIKAPGYIYCAPYHEGDRIPGYDNGNPMAGLDTIVGRHAAISYPHVTNHLTGSYAMSPWANANEPCYAIMWDGGTGARLYRMEPANIAEPIKLVAHLHHYYGMLYGIMGYYAGPYKEEEYTWRTLSLQNYNNLFGRRDWPGKLMSWVAKGKPDRLLMNAMWEFTNKREQEFAAWPGYLNDAYNQNGNLEHAFMRSVMERADHMGPMPDADVLASVHEFLKELLVERAVTYIPYGSKLLFTGGSALNIKWNSALRATGHFSGVFVPPTPNDSGSAIGAAVTEQIQQGGEWAIKWDVFSGPRLFTGDILPGWSARECTPARLAKELMLFPYDPIVVLNGRAEIGPRALGHRSILMAPGARCGKSIMNELKGREEWRPVAPICLEDQAPFYFSPGTPDPYMLFDHHVRTEDDKRDMPAIVHIDGTARLQTVGDPDSLMYKVLSELPPLGLPAVLCNTSANLNGSGFFPDLVSAMRWGKVDRIWANGTLYRSDQ